MLSLSYVEFWYLELGKFALLSFSFTLPVFLENKFLLLSFSKLSPKKVNEKEVPNIPVTSYLFLF